MAYPRVISETQTLLNALEGSNIARFGNGEIQLALGNDCSSQVYSEDLGRRLREILKSPAIGCLPCIPNIATPGPKADYWRKYTRPTYTRLYDPRRTYGSAFISRPDSSPNKFTADTFALIRRLWTGKRVCLVTGTDKSLTPIDVAGAAHISHITVADRNAYAVYKDVVFRKMLEVECDIFLLCCGAMATVAADDLAKARRHAVDLGHIGMFIRKFEAGEPLTRTDNDRY